MGPFGSSIASGTSKGNVIRPVQPCQDQTATADYVGCLQFAHLNYTLNTLAPMVVPWYDVEDVVNAVSLVRVLEEGHHAPELLAD